MQAAKGSRSESDPGCRLYFFYLFSQNKWLSCIQRLASCAWWHIRHLFLPSAADAWSPRLFGPCSDAWLYLCTHNYVRLWGWQCARAAACDGWRWREKSPGVCCAADIKISSRESRGERGGLTLSLPYLPLSFIHIIILFFLPHPFVNMFSGAPITSSLTSTSCTSLGNTTTTTLQLPLIRHQAQVSSPPTSEGMDDVDQNASVCMRWHGPQANRSNEKTAPTNFVAVVLQEIQEWLVFCLIS